MKGCNPLTLKASSFNSRRSERPAERTTRDASTLKGPPNRTEGRPFQGRCYPNVCYPGVLATLVPSAIERRRFQRHIPKAVTRVGNFNI